MDDLRAIPRRLLPALLIGCASALPTDAFAREVRVWVEMEEMPFAASQSGRDIHQALRELGAIEIGRTRHVGRAMAVRIPSERLDALRALPGVRRVRPADPLHPPRMNAPGGERPVDGPEAK